MSGIDYKAVDAIMSQAQAFASAWALVGGRLDQGGEMANAEEQKAALKQLVKDALQKASGGPCMANFNAHHVEQNGWNHPCRCPTCVPCFCAQCRMARCQSCAAFGRHYCPEHA